MVKNKMTANSKVIANGFCSFFSTVANKLKTKVLQIKDFVWAMPATEHRKTYNQFRFKQVTVAEVFKYLKNLLRKKAIGPDNLPPGILKDVAVIIAKPLCHIINISMKNGIVPSAFKLGKITLIYDGVKT